MKCLLIAALVAVAITACQTESRKEIAQPVSDSVQAAERSELRGVLDSDASFAVKRCTSLSILARKTMRGRQRGAKMSDYLRVVEGMEPDLRRRGVPADVAETYVSLHENMVKDAYTVPRYSTDRYKLEAEENFENKWFQNCYAIMDR